MIDSVSFCHTKSYKKRRKPYDEYKMYNRQWKIPFSEGFVRSIFCQTVPDN